MNIKPLFDKVVVESLTVEEKTKSGFYLPTSAQEKPQTCQVVAVGPGGIIDGKEVEINAENYMSYLGYVKDPTCLSNITWVAPTK